jgi:hypothetical protein
MRLRQFLADIRHRRNIDLYATALVALVFVILLLVGADLSDDLRWSVVFAALAVLVLRNASATIRPALDEVLLDRTAYAKDPISSHLAEAGEVWIFAPTGVNFLTAERCEILRKGPLARRDGVVRIVVLDNTDDLPQTGVVHQLDQLLDFPVQQVADALREIHGRLRAMAGWQVSGRFECGTLSFSPGFSIVAVDPSKASGFVIVEFHGFRNETIAARMHIRLDRRDEIRWYRYWLEQFDAIWRASAPLHAEGVA